MVNFSHFARKKRAQWHGQRIFFFEISKKNSPIFKEESCEIAKEIDRFRQIF
jgi:hypothetical protein